MDDRRFDALARLLATRRSRRSFLRAAVGAAAAGLLARLPAARPAAAARKRCRADAECADGNACTTDRCVNGACRNDPIAGCCTADAQCQHLNDQCHAGVCAGDRCVPSPAADGTPCNDGNACTQTDTCQAGQCVGGDPVVCTALDACHDAGVCDPATGQCSQPAKPNGTPCSDDNACTQTDTCQAGVCTPGTDVVCPAPGPCQADGVCNPTTGQCRYSNLADGTPCDDGNACTQRDTCRAGVCAGFDVGCADTQCLPGSCNPATGQCEYTALEDGTPCDVYACTTGDTCQDGVCVAGAPVVCDGGQVCLERLGGCVPVGTECTTDTDCVLAWCCHAYSCTNRAQALPCDGAVCSSECQSFSMDCGQGYCACQNGWCGVVWPDIY